MIKHILYPFYSVHLKDETGEDIEFDFGNSYFAYFNPEDKDKWSNYLNKKIVYANVTIPGVKSGADYALSYSPSIEALQLGILAANRHLEHYSKIRLERVGEVWNEGLFVVHGIYYALVGEK